MGALLILALKSAKIKRSRACERTRSERTGPEKMVTGMG